ncbi:MAG: helix-turn-helix domain-containing protein [Anaerolineae bacterium]
MSLGDYIRYLRALKGGPTPWEMSEEGGIPSSEYRQIEQRYREVATDETIEKLATYFGVPAAELLRRRGWSRKQLSADLDRAQRGGRRIHLMLRTGECLSGWVEWFDLGAALLRPEGGDEEIVVQRHIVDEWVLESPGETEGQ